MRIDELFENIQKISNKMWNESSTNEIGDVVCYFDVLKESLKLQDILCDIEDEFDKLQKKVKRLEKVENE